MICTCCAHRSSSSMANERRMFDHKRGRATEWGQRTTANAFTKAEAIYNEAQKQ